jgi:short-subunit dehydrogenase involved in D-alanine esterification of teichoic acids
MNATESELINKVLLLERRERRLREIMCDFMSLMKDMQESDLKRQEIKELIDALHRNVQ